jgi:hypothetical protein
MKRKVLSWSAIHPGHEIRLVETTLADGSMSYTIEIKGEHYASLFMSDLKAAEELYRDMATAVERLEIVDID